MASMVPLAAAGRDPLFFYGTLADVEVLARVLGRLVDAGDLAPAWLAGFVRVSVAAGAYPALLPAEGGETEGLLLRQASRRDIARINHFEAGEYRAEMHEVRLADGTSCRAWLYAGMPVLVGTGDPWRPDEWRQWHKPGFFVACDGWMADCPEGE